MATSILTLGITAAAAINTARNEEKSLEAQKEGQEIRTASGENSNRVARRRAAREARINRARLKAASSATGTSGSSGFFGASSAITANQGSAVAAQRDQEIAARGLSAVNQRIADAESNSRIFNAYAGVAIKGLDMFEDQINASFGG